MTRKRGEDTKERILTAAKALVMAKGFAGTSIDDILKDAELTKGAFFHYFKSKGDLACQLVEWHAAKDLTTFETWAREAAAEYADPLDQMIHFLKLFERYISNSKDPSPGCMYAVYTYESMQFDPSVRDFVADTLRKWTAIYVRMFQNILDLYEPARPVTARQLAEMIVAIIEGGLVLQRSYEDVQVTCRQSEQFRTYLQLLFGESVRARRGKPAEGRAGAKALPA